MITQSIPHLLIPATLPPHPAPRIEVCQRQIAPKPAPICNPGPVKVDLFEGCGPRTPCKALPIIYHPVRFSRPTLISLLDLPAVAIVPAPLAELPLKPAQPRIVVPNSPSQQAIASNRYNEARKLASMLISFGIAASPDVHTAQWIAPDNIWRYDLHPLANGIIVRRRKPNHHQWIVAEQCVTSKGEYEAIRADLERKYGIELEIYNKRIGHVATPADKIVVTREADPADKRTAYNAEVVSAFQKGYSSRVEQQAAR